MNDDRRERYAAALAARTTGVYDAADHLEIQTPDAVMAVADEENARLRAELERKEDARLDALAAVGIHRDTIESLRAELASKDAANGGLARALAKNQMRVERVRAVLDESGDSESADTLVGLLRTALEGTRCGGCGEPTDDGSVHGVNQGFGGCV